MAVHAHAVSQTMGEVFVVWPIAPVGDNLARGVVHRTALRSRLCGRQRGTLRAVHDVENLFHFVAGFAEHEGARDVGSVALHGAAAIDEHDRALANKLRRD